MIYKNVANCLLTKITQMQISKLSGPDVSILAGPFSKAEKRPARIETSGPLNSKICILVILVSKQFATFLYIILSLNNDRENFDWTGT